MVSKRVSRWSLALVVIAVLATVNVYQFLQPREIQQIATAPKQVPALEKFKASGYSSSLEYAFLVMDAGKNRDIWQKYGLDPEFVTIGRTILAADLKEQVQSGVKIGFTLADTVILARSAGVPVKFVAGFIGLAPNKVFVRPDSPMKTVKDMDGQRIGVVSNSSAVYRILLYLSNKLSINPKFVSIGNLTNQVVALKLGQTDGFISAEGAALRLAESGELKILFQLSDELPKPWVGVGVFATDDLIEQNPDLVRRFVAATLETVKYLSENPRYAVELYITKSGAPPDLAEKVVSQITWTPSGRGSGQDLLTAVANGWQVSKDSGAVASSINVKIDDAVDIRFLP